MEKRVVLAFVLSLAIIFLYQMFFVKWMAPPPVKKTASEAVSGQPEKKLEMGNAVSSKTEGGAPVPEQAEEVITVETPLYRAVISSKGGGIKSWELKEYKEGLEKTAGNVQMIAPALEEYPLQDKLYNGGAPEIIYFKPSVSSISVNPGQTENLSLTWQSPDGLRIEKRYTFSANSYSIGVEAIAANASEKPFEGRLTSGFASSIKFLEKRGGTYHKGPILYSDGQVSTKDIKKEGEEKLSGKVDWLGLEEMYFISAIMPKKMENAIFSSVVDGDMAKTTFAVPLNLPPQASISATYSAYIGPKETGILTAQGVHMEDSIDYGWFPFGRSVNRTIARPLLTAMNFLYSYIHNYGLVIILLTVAIKILFHPLTKKSIDSMKGMQKIQPQIVALRERYKDDREKMNREVMDLYKRYKINPLGGCLPMILQIPVFIALYNVLATSIELRHAPFALWIHDLSSKDPYYISPIIMGATMLIQQKMTPSGMDPTQAKMMLIMPVVFTFMFLSFPSGLVIYWLVNNVLSIAQQYYIQKAAK